ncbi:hypothetical protein I4U23_011246 [Adineta vaga]|nr:hypothetical protein I4U23_011246 [Adineta vaga]
MSRYPEMLQLELTIKLDTLTETAAIVGLKFSSNTNNSSIQPILISQDSILHAKWDDLCITIPLKPNNVSILRKLPKFVC